MYHCTVVEGGPEDVRYLCNLVHGTLLEVLHLLLLIWESLQLIFAEVIKPNRYM